MAKNRRMELVTHNIRYKTYLSEIVCRLMRPIPRESSASCLMGDHIFQFGGRSRLIMSDM